MSHVSGLVNFAKFAPKRFTAASEGQHSAIAFNWDGVKDVSYAVGETYVCYETLDSPKEFFERVVRVSVMWVSGPNDTHISKFMMTGRQWSSWLVLRGKQILKDSGNSRLYIPLLDVDGGIDPRHLDIHVVFSKEQGDETERARLVTKLHAKVTDYVAVRAPRNIHTSELKHGQAEVVLDMGGVSNDDYPEQVCFHIPGANHCIKSGSVRAIFASGNDAVHEFDSPYEASVLDKVLNGRPTARGGHILTCEYGALTASGDRRPENVQIRLVLDGELVPDGATLECFYNARVGPLCEYTK